MVLKADCMHWGHPQFISCQAAAIQLSASFLSLFIAVIFPKWSIHGWNDAGRNWDCIPLLRELSQTSSEQCLCRPLPAACSLFASLVSGWESWWIPSVLAFSAETKLKLDSATDHIPGQAEQEPFTIKESHYSEQDWAKLVPTSSQVQDILYSWKDAKSWKAMAGLQELHQVQMLLLIPLLVSTIPDLGISLNDEFQIIPPSLWIVLHQHVIDRWRCHLHKLQQQINWLSGWLVLVEDKSV